MRSAAFLALPLALGLGLAAPAGANPVDRCLDRAADPQAGLASCKEAEAMLRLLGRETSRNDPQNNPVLPPALRGSPTPLAAIALARADHEARLASARQRAEPRI